MKQFDVPVYYKSPIISKIKALRKDVDPKKKDYTPTKLDFGPVEFLIARHFGFCYGVENAIEISYKALKENPNKKVYLLSEMIHNPSVNQDLMSRGIKFIMDTSGKQLIPWEEVTSEAVVIIPAFGTTLEVMRILEEKQISTEKYNTTCPFVERVWKMSGKLGNGKYTIIIHGKYNHEETRATFSHATQDGPAIIVKNIEEAQILAKYIRKELPKAQFYKDFEGKFSSGFDPEVDLQKIGVINQTTMLATETKEIAQYLKQEVERSYGGGKDSFADTRDSLCYATNDNQNATYGLLEEDADLAVIVGGYNSSNTTHLVELCEQKVPTYFINSEENLKENNKIEHFEYRDKTVKISQNYLPEKGKVRVILTSGASCPDAEVDKVLMKILKGFENTIPLAEVLKRTEDIYGQS